jgi:hypothetical protein
MSSIHAQAFLAAQVGDEQTSKKLFAQGADVDMLIMGVSPKDVPRTNEQKAICHFALQNGACWLFSMWQPEPRYMTIMHPPQYMDAGRG